MARLAITLAVLALIGCAGDNSKTNERVAFWKESLDRELPAGTSIDKAKDWALKKGIQFTYLEQQRWLYANVEQVPQTGIPFPCSAWNVIVKIPIDSAGRTVQNEVNAVGSCL